jgi:hypothetical protein
LKRLENEHWNEDEKKVEREFLTYIRGVQRAKSKISHYILALTAVFFGVGFTCMAIVISKLFIKV